MNRAVNAPAPPHQRRGIPSLDGLRALSIGLVILAHLMGTRNFPIREFNERVAILGTLGVRVFFVISGFLITSLLIGERGRTGQISLTRFYFRRSMRLFPAAYVLCLTVAALSSLSLLSLRPGDFLFASTYLMNFHHDRAWPLGHLWSLAVEEQFYLIWPAIFAYCTSVSARRVLYCVLLLAPVTRLLAVYVGPAFSFFIWADALATGCLLALIRPQLHANRNYLRLMQPAIFWVIPVTALFANFLPSYKVQWLAGDTLVNLCIAISVDWAMNHANSAVGRFLNWRVVSFVGVLSYSLYLWQQLFLNRYSSSTICSFPLNLFLLSGVALLSYFAIESPSLALRSRLEARWAAPRPHQHKVSIR
jgi:peptidoglycan/LPS O-acetylase OafA/YrhL